MGNNSDYFKFDDNVNDFKNDSNNNIDSYNDVNNITSLGMDNDVNTKNEDEFKRIIKHAEVNRDDYYDRNNIFVRVVLYILLAIAVVGVAYYVIMFFTL